MYRPDLFRVDDLPRLHALMRARPLAALISAGADGLTRHPPADRAQGRRPVRHHRMPRRPRQSALEDARRRGADDLSGAGGLHHAELVSVESRARQGGADLELRRDSCLWPPRSDRGRNVAAPPRRRAHCSTGSRRGKTLGGQRRARKLRCRHGARHRRHPPADRAPRRQMEDEPEPRAEGSRRRRRRPRPARRGG